MTTNSTVLTLRRAARPKLRTLRAFTLFEVLLVLSLMVIVATTASLSVRGGIQRQRLVKAAEQLRLAWAKARVEAIKTGRVQVFYHAPLDRRYFVMPQQSLDDPPPEQSRDLTGLRSGSVSRTSAQGRAGMNNLNIDRADIHPRELPRGVVFLAADIQTDQRSTLSLSDASDPATLGNNVLSFGDDQELPEQWGMPLFFYPNGTSSVARVILRNERQQGVVVYLRGMTGMARVGTVQPIEQLEAEIMP